MEQPRFATPKENLSIGAVSCAPGQAQRRATVPSEGAERVRREGSVEGLVLGCIEADFCKQILI